MLVSGRRPKLIRELNVAPQRDVRSEIASRGMIPLTGIEWDGEWAKLFFRARLDRGYFESHVSARFGLPVVADSVPDFAGPLAGILAGLDWAAEHAPAIPYLVSAPGDCPFLPRDLVEHLHQARLRDKVPLACARSGDWRHPVIGLWPVSLRENLRSALITDGLRKIEVWTARHGVAIADWPSEPIDPFFNVNTPEDAAAAERIATQSAEA